MLSRHPSVIRFALMAARIGRHYVLSPSSSTVWTWRSRRDTAARVPSGDNSFFEPAADACGGDYLCVARKGYDAPTGLGSPDGTRAF